jgi:Amt family ammonium transporter
VGGVAALTGAMVLGPRIGKYSPEGKSLPMPGHHLPMAMLGTFILLFGWFGFNAASTLSATDVQFATVAANTAISGAFGAVASMFWITRRTGKPNPGMMINGMLAGLVAITAACAFVSPWAAALIGSVAAILVIESTIFVEERLRIDDPCGVISVHGVCGMFGVLAVGIFANGSYGAGWNGSESTGVAGIIKGDWGQFGAQALGAVTILVVNFTLSYGFFSLQNRFTKGGIRPTAADEIAGLDSEMGVSAYTEFELVRHKD